MTGAFSGKIFSTPIPPEAILRTTKVGSPLALIAITSPSNTWMRDFSPSLMLWCTRTVSPTLKVTPLWVAEFAIWGILSDALGLGNGREEASKHRMGRQGARLVLGVGLGGDKEGVNRPR